MFAKRLHWDIIKSLTVRFTKDYICTGTFFEMVKSLNTIMSLCITLKTSPLAIVHSFWQALVDILSLDLIDSNYWLRSFFFFFCTVSMRNPCLICFLIIFLFYIMVHLLLTLDAFVLNFRLLLSLQVTLCG